MQSMGNTYLENTQPNPRRSVQQRAASAQILYSASHFPASGSDIRPFAPETIPPDKQKSIRQLIRNRKISCLTHFTRVENLKSILRNGILSRAMLASDPQYAQVRRNPPGLPQSWQGAVSLNLSFPDYRLFYNLQDRAGYEWAVLLIDPQILTRQAFYYFSRSAGEMILEPDFASSSLPFLQRYETLEGLFADDTEHPRARLEIPDAYPTHPQAEILTFSPILAEAIQQVHFYNDYKFNQWFLSNMDFALTQNKKLWYASLEYFSPRCDYAQWRTRR